VKISVCIATFNGEQYICKQLQSIISQIGSEDEIVISDDGSSDHTIDMIRSFADNRIKLFSNSFANPILNFEFALSQSSGDIIFLSDQDDIWYENKVSRTKELLRYYDLVVADAEIIDANDRLISKSLFSVINSGRGILKNITKNTYVGCCMAFNRRILDKALPFPRLVPMHDMWIGLIGELFGKTFFCREALIAYRRHNGNISQTGGKSPNSLIKKIKIRRDLIAGLLPRYLSGIMDIHRR
jgi:glycosyltransferase involved in cell wall biosynthesis